MSGDCPADRPDLIVHKSTSLCDSFPPDKPFVALAITANDRIDAHCSRVARNRSSTSDRDKCHIGKVVVMVIVVIQLKSSKGYHD